MRQSSVLAVAALLMAGCATHETLTSVDTRAENVGHQRLDPTTGTGSMRAAPLQSPRSAGTFPSAK